MTEFYNFFTSNIIGLMLISTAGAGYLAADVFDNNKWV